MVKTAQNIGVIGDVGDTDFANFTPELSPVSTETAERVNVGPQDGSKFPIFDNSLLGVIVDRSSFDEDDELTTYNGKDEPSIIHKHPTSLNLPQHQQLDLGDRRGGVMMKNGKVRRRMRWKPRFGKKKSANNFSSNASVVSALTNRSSATSRSSSTTRSLLSHFSKRSNTSFHTFHSTETPVATNRANRPQAPHTVMRPNYQDSFDPTNTTPKHTTIDSDNGKYAHRQRMGGSQFSVSSTSGFPSTKLDSVIESSSSSEQQQQQQPQEEVEVNHSSALSPPISVVHNNSGRSSPIPEQIADSVETVTKTNSSSNSVGTKSARSTGSIGSAQKQMSPAPKNTKSSLQNPSKPKRPPLFKRRLRHNKIKTMSNSSTNSPKASSPTDTNSTVSLSASISLERENSGLPVLMGDEEDRRVGIQLRHSSPMSIRKHVEKTNSILDSVLAEEGAEESSVSPTVQSSVSGSQSGGSQSVHSASSAVVTVANTPASLQKRLPSMSKKRSTSSLSTASPKFGAGGSVNSPPSPGDSSIRSSQLSQEGGTQSSTSSVLSSKQLNRTTNASKSVDDGNPKTKGKMGGRSKTMSVPCDLDEGAFLEAEHNLRAIHDMAAEHLAHGEFEEAADVFEEILRGQQERYGQDHYRVGTALHNLGIVYLKKGDYDKAIEICHRAVDVRKDSLVPNHPDVAVSLAQLGVAHLESQNYHEALTAFRDALHIRRNFLGPKHPKCSKILNNIGCALYSIEDLISSKRAFDEALDIQREALRSLPSKEGYELNGAQSNTLLLSMASTLCNIGSIGLRWGDFEKAEVALEEALLIQQSVLGDDHPTVCSTMDSIELVETAKACAANPRSPHEFLMNKAAAVCSHETPTDVMTEMLGIENFDSISPKNWFLNPCGPDTYDSQNEE